MHLLTSANRLRSLSTIALLSALALLPCRAQYAPPPPARPFSGFINEALRAKDVYLSAWDVGANYRFRAEDKLGAGTTDAGSNGDFSKRPPDDNNNLYYLSRLMPRVGYTDKWFAFLVEARSSYSIKDERYNATAAGQGLTENDAGVDFHQAFVFVGNHKEFPLSLRIGRQELNYGDQRIVGAFRWNNIARTFDAVKLRWQNAIFGVDLFTGGVVYTRSNHLNRSNPKDRFSGAYFNFNQLGSLTRNNVVEAYLLARNVKRSIATDNWSGVPAPFRFPGAQDLYTAGIRLKSKPGAYGPWDYGIEAMYQFGNRTAVFPAATVAAALAAPRLDQHAYATVIQAGYTWTGDYQPRLALVYSHGSGDKDSTDGASNTFQNLFPTNHLFYGYMDLNSLQNLHDVRLAYTIKPTATSMLALEGHTHYLDRTSDFWYNVAGVPRNFPGAAVGSGGGYRINPGYSRHVGDELDFVAGWTFTPSAQIEAAAAHYFRGDYIKQSLAAVGSKDANYVYVQFTLNL